MPRTPANLAAGNFMLDLVLRGPGAGTVRALLYDGYVDEPQKEPEQGGQVLAHSRRPVILTYRSAPVELAHKVTQLPLYLLGWRHEAETIEAVLMEGVEFEKGWRNVPASLWLEVRSSNVLQVYGVRVVFTARFGGLRYDTALFLLSLLSTCNALLNIQNFICAFGPIPAIRTLKC